MHTPQACCARFFATQCAVALCHNGALDHIGSSVHIRTHQDMAGYTKLFSSIIHSTIWAEPHTVRIVWITLMAMADAHGDVMTSLPGLARAAGVTRSECEHALQTLSSPDRDSTSPDHQGRRILRIEGGWALVNHAKYQRLLTLEERRERDAERKRRERSGKTESVQASSEMSQMSREIQHSAPSPTPAPSPALSPAPAVAPEGGGVQGAAPAPSGAPKPKRQPRSVTTLLPDDFAPNAEHTTIARSRGVDLAEEFAKMRDWALSKAVRKADWGATLRNWLRRAEPSHGAPGARGAQRSRNAEVFDYIARKATEV